MKKFLFILIVAGAGTLFFFQTPADTSKEVQPYQDSGSQLLIPQKNVVIAAVDLKKSSISLFNEKTLEKLERLQQSFQNLKGVTRVESLLNASTVISTEDEILVQPIIPGKETRDDSFFRSLPSALANHPELKPYVSEKGDALLFYIYFGYKVSPGEIDKGLTGVQKKYRNLKFEYTGKSPIVARTEVLLTEDIAVFLPLLAILVLVVFLAFRDLKAILTSWLLIILAVAASYSFIHYLGIKTSPIILLIPVFSLGLLSDYAIHYFYHHFYAPGNKTSLHVRKKLLFPLTLTALSTLTGFLSLVFISGSGHLLLGSVISVSVVLTYGGIFLWLPYIRFKRHNSDILLKFEHVQVKLFLFFYKWKKIVYGVLAVVIAMGLFLLPNLKIEPYPIKQLPRSTTIRKADDIINRDFYGTLPYFLEIDTGVKNGAISQQALITLDKIHKILDNSDVIGYSYSMLSVLKQLSYYFEGDRNILLKNREMGNSFVEQYLLYYSSSVDPLVYESMINSSYRICSVSGLLYYKDVSSLENFYRVIDKVKTVMPPGWNLKVHGMVTQLSSEEKSLKRNWVFSFFSGSFLIFIMVLGFYKKLRLALLSLVPGVISMIFSFGIISIAGISIDSFSIIFVAIVIGLVIDYSIHTLSAIDSIQQISSVDEGFIQTINFSGKPIYLSFLTSLFSFSVLFLSSFKGARALGLLLFSSLLISYFLSVYLLPIIMLPYKIRAETKNAGEKL